MEQNGIINLLKPAGMTSHDCVYFLRKLSGIKRIGHTGTLDPMAVGVLPLCIGSATRIMDYLDLDHKIYRCEMILGITTDTWDIWGKVLNDSRNSFDKPDIKAIMHAFQPFIGEIMQLPPSYSSVRVEGKRLYEYAREHKEVKVSKRPVRVYRIDIIEYERITGRITFDLECSKGTYVRSICNDVGNALGCGGAMSFLLRMASGDFLLEDTVSFENLEKVWWDYLLPIDFPLKRFGKLTISEDRAVWFGNGGYLRPREVEILKQPSSEDISKHIRIRDGLDRAYCVYAEERFLGVALYDEGKKLYTADKVLSK